MNLSSSAQLDTSRVSTANGWDIALNTRRQSSYPQAGMQYSVYGINKLITTFWRFSEDFRPLSEDVRRFSKIVRKSRRAFPSISEHFPNITEDFRGWTMMFRSQSNTIFSITGKKIAESYGYFFGKWNKYYRERHNMGPYQRMSKLSFKG